MEKNLFLQGRIKDEMKNSKANLNGKWRFLMCRKRRLGIKVSWSSYNITNGNLIQGQNWQLEIARLIIMASGEDFFSPRPNKIWNDKLKRSKRCTMLCSFYASTSSSTRSYAQKKPKHAPKKHLVKKIKEKELYPFLLFDPLSFMPFHLHI
jgi:hypothetical protein